MAVQKSIKVNAVLNATKTVIGLLFPLITFPYVSRILQPGNLGKVNYATSIVYYFTLVAALGIKTYAVREGAKYRDDSRRLKQFADEVFTINMVTTAIAYILLAGCLQFIQKLQPYTVLLLLLSVSMLFTTVGIDWLNVIYEDYFIITVRSILIQVANLTMLFILVRAESDYYKYAFLSVLSEVLICIWNRVYCSRRYFRVGMTRKCNFQTHLKPMLVLFANNLAVSIYVSVDTTMLGWMAGDTNVGIYAVAVKAYNVMKNVLVSVYTVCIPRFSNYFGNGDAEAARKLGNTILSGLILLLLPISVGVCTIAEPIILFLGGIEYRDAVPALRILTVAFFFAIIGGVFSNCINIPMGKEKVSLSATMIAAITNLGLNLFFIPLWKQTGAAITTAIAEATVVIVCYLKNREIRGFFYWKEIRTNFIHALIGSLGIVLLFYILCPRIENDLVFCFVMIIGSVALYAVILLALRNRYAYSIICATIGLKKRQSK